MNEPSALKRQPRNDRHSADHAGEAAFNLPRTILQAERDQKADEARIDVAITKAESEIAALEQRHLGPKELQRAIITIRDQAILAIRDVRKNMVMIIALRNSSGPRCRRSSAVISLSAFVIATSIRASSAFYAERI